MQFFVMPFEYHLIMRKVMLTIPGFEIHHVLYESKRCSIAVVTKISDQQKFIMKVLSEKVMSPHEVRKFRHEFEIGSEFNSPYIIKHLELYSSSQHLAILLEANNVLSLEKFIPENGFSIEQFLKIAVQMVKGISEIHRKGITHRDIKPANFLINSTTEEIKIIDFGSASRLKEESQSVQNIDKFEGTLAYISPEQTGRMNRNVDYRTDFYSLGVTFYQMLNGKLPFAKKDAMELIHCHLAYEATPLRQAMPVIPEVISQLVQLLMMKNAEDRYQSTQGLLHDLQICQQLISTNHTIEPFVLRQNDYSEKFQVSQKLYGRTNEIKTLLTIFERINHGKPEVLAVAGYSGIGKSVFINEIQKPITLKNGRFLAGKFDQLSKSVAYSAISQAFQMLVKQLLSESESNIQLWREALLTALGSNGQLIIEVIPEIERIIGKQPPVPIVGPTEAKNRFNNVFQKFIRVFPSKNHPVVLFLDDIQWADTVSLELIKLIMSNVETQYLMLIVAYRDNEVNDSHPAILTLQELAKTQIPVQIMTLTSLDSQSLRQWIADSLQLTPNEIQPLTDIIYQKTQGNPFFVKMFTRSLYDEKLLTLSDSGRWQWDLVKIQQRAATANVVEFMVSRIQQLAPSTQMMLATSSCLGHVFAIDRLEIATQQKQEELHQGLQDIYNAGLAYREEDTIHFAHDRVQEAAYSLSLLPDRQKKLIHLLMGRQLLRQSLNQENPENLFEIIDHLNKGLEFINDAAERISLAKLNLLAGQKAKNAVAYATGLNYIQAGLNCLEEQHLWSIHYSLTFSLYREKAELEHSASLFEQAETTMQLLIDHAQTVIEKADIYNLLITQKTLLTKDSEAIQLGKIALALLGLALPEAEDALAERFEQEKSEINHILAQQDLLNFATQPDLKDAHKKATLKLLSSLLGTTYVSNRPLYNVVTASSIKFSLQYGPIPEAALGFVFYGSILCSEPETASLGYQFGLLATKLCERYQILAQICKSFYLIAIVINPWFKSLDACQALNSTAFQAGLDSGEMQYAGYSQFYSATLLLSRGEALPDAWSELSNIREVLLKMKHQFSIDVVHSAQEVVAELMGIKNIFASSFDIEDLRKRNNFFALGHHAIFQAQLLYHREQYQEAYQMCREAEKLSPYLSGLYLLATHNFYYCLTLTALYSTATAQEQQVYYKEINHLAKIFEAWVQNCPENFQANYLLMRAEIARIDKKLWEAGQLYDQAIEAAQSQDHPPGYALANELAGKFWLAENRKVIAQTYLSNAYLGYQRWGAKKIMQQMKANYHAFLKADSALEGVTASSQTFAMTATTTSLVLDMQNVIKASQMISSDIELEKLLFNMMKIIIETAGAQKGALLLHRDGKLMVEAEYTARGQIQVLQHLPLSSWEEGAISVIEFVKNTGQVVMLDRATEDKQFGFDSYLSSKKVKSLLCLAIKHQEEFRGLLYVENNLAYHAFSQTRAMVLTILASQMAISLENSRLVEEKLDALNKITQEQRHRAEEAEAYKKNLEHFIAVFSHEMRNPLGIVLANSELIRDLAVSLSSKVSKSSASHLKQETADEYKDLIECNQLVMAAAGIQLRIANDVLELARLTDAKVRLQTLPFSPKETITHCLDMFAAELRKKDLASKVEFSSNEDIIVLGDPDRLKQIINNLLTNAIKFTQPNGAIHIKIVPKRSLTFTEFIITIQDNGQGMSEEEQTQIFKKFGQGNLRISPEHGGSGLGLSIAKNLIHLMEGNISVSSKKGEGSSFTFNIKCSNLSKKHKMSLQNSLIEKTEIVFENKTSHAEARLLIVDDNKVNRLTINRMLQRAGYQCELANNGQEAVDMFEKSNFDLILMDIRMPIMDGLEATKAIRKKEAESDITQGVFIIGLSANASENDKLIALEAGMNAYLIKPVSKDELYETVSAQLKSRQKIESDKFSPTNNKKIGPTNFPNFFSNKKVFSSNTVPFLLGKMPNSDVPIEFEEHFVTPDGDCGFTALGVNRQQLVASLLLLENNFAAREFLAKVIETALRSQEITLPDAAGQQIIDAVYHKQGNLDSLFRKIQATLTDETAKKLERDHLITWLQNNNRDNEAQVLIEQRLELYQAERELENYCQSPAMFKHYVKAFIDTALWLDYKSALLYARQANISLYIWRKDEHNVGHLTLIDYHDFIGNTNTAQNEIHLLFTAGFTHFNLLSKSALQEDVRHAMQTSEGRLENYLSSILNP
jgi:predicted ATPase/signal transduction histidine kinase/CheY-like chemotaxis protein/tRNA A-37 threonylcarbamoyl transferase component Bud32